MAYVQLKNNYRSMNPERARRKRLHYLFMPDWADGKCVAVFFLTLLSVIGACVSCYLNHTYMFTGVLHPLGLKIWFFGLAAFVGNSVFIIKGVYQKYFDMGLDAYY